jgi:hypothetical protein
MVVGSDAVHLVEGEDADGVREATASKLAKYAVRRWPRARASFCWRSRCGNCFGWRLPCSKMDEIKHPTMLVGCAGERRLVEEEWWREGVGTHRNRG